MFIEYHVRINSEIDSDPIASQRILEISGKPPEAGKMQGGIHIGFRGSMVLLMS